MGNVIKIPEETTIGYLTTKIEDQLPDTILDFPQLCRYVDITSQTIYRQEEYPLQCIQLKMLLNNFNNIFASKNEFGRTNIIQHQIKTGDTMPIKSKEHTEYHQPAMKSFVKKLTKCLTTG
ncbi:hypothetical protein G9A89_024002 [Geosiphon pyriformis]|nr:hypothetical protein G9A89_024002 [Geosiphon pyriformis]